MLNAKISRDTAIRRDFSILRDSTISALPIRTDFNPVDFMVLPCFSRELINLPAGKDRFGRSSGPNAVCFNWLGVAYRVVGPIHTPRNGWGVIRDVSTRDPSRLKWFVGELGFSSNPSRRHRLNGVDGLSRMRFIRDFQTR